MAETLSRLADYRVLRRLVPRVPSAPAAGLETKTAILIDTETTGLDHRKDEVIELGMVKFDYTSATEIDWRAHGFAGAQLGYLLNGARFFHHAHRAVDDCHSLLEILDFTLQTTGAPALALLLETARKKTVRVWAEQSAYELKDSLKRRGYRWSDGTDGRPKSWYIDVCESALDDEIAFLRSEIYMRDVEPGVQRLTAFTRFSARI
jgi:DNA polymerase III epsilon subunit-like protein